MSSATQTTAKAPQALHDRAATTPMQRPTKPEGPTGEFSGNIKVSQKVPSRAEMEKVADLPVLDRNGNQIPFKSLVAGGETGAGRVLLIFIRHFFCGVRSRPPPVPPPRPDHIQNCQEYLRTLCASVTPAALLALPAPAQIVVIGCGQPELIDFYADATACPFPIYADPTKRLYGELGMTRTLRLGSARPAYMQQSILRGALMSIVQELSSGRKAFKGGDIWQVGGEFLFENGSAAWCHRMANTRDHAEVPELRARLGLDGDVAPPMRKRWTLNPAALRRTMSSRRPS
jgi:hypothetical protein